MEKLILHEAYKRLDKIKHPVIVVIGAYTGNDVIEFAKKYPTGTIHAIEACPVNFKILKDRVVSLKNVVCDNIAISNENGIVDFYYANQKKNNGTSQGNSLYKKFVSQKKWVKEAKVIKIKSLTLDAFYKLHKINYVDFLKINAEGAEYKIFENPEFVKNTNMIYVILHAKQGIFNELLFVKKRKEIYGKLCNMGLGMIKGTVSSSKNKHHPQLWAR